MLKKRRILLLALCLLTALCFSALADGDIFAISNQETRLFEGDTLQLELTRSGLPETGEIVWTSSAPKTVTVDENGLATAIGPGKARVTAVCNAEGKSFKASVTLQVQRKVTGITLKDQRLTILTKDDPLLSGILQSPTELPVLVIFRGTSAGLSFTVEPKDASDRHVDLTSSDESIVKVNGTTIQGLAVGECDLTVSSRLNPEVSVSWHVLVAEKVTGIKISAPAKSLGAGTTLQLTASVLPENATFRQVIWSSSNEQTASVDENGLVTGLARGSAGIRAQAVDGTGKAASFSLNITQLPEEVTLSESATTVAVGCRKTLKAAVLPSSTNNKKVTWSSSDESICTVNNMGTLTPVKAGSCTVTCTTQDNPGVQAVCAVTVTQPITKIIFDAKKVPVKVGDVLQLNWTVEPADVTDPSLVFTSNNRNVATVDENGVVHPIKRGEATITAKAADGSRRTGSIVVQVIQPVTGVHMEYESVRVGVGERTTLKVALEPKDASNRNMTWTVADPEYATITGTTDKPVVRGVRWGSTTVHGITEDGSFETDCIIDVGNYNKALKITKVEVKDNEVKLSIKNLSNMYITRLWGEIEVTDLFGGECPSTVDELSLFTFRYSHPIEEGESTHHGRFRFVNYLKPTVQIGSVRIIIKGYETDTGFSWKIRNPERTLATWYDPEYTGPKD